MYKSNKLMFPDIQIKDGYFIFNFISVQKKYKFTIQ